MTNATRWVRSRAWTALLTVCVTLGLSGSVWGDLEAPLPPAGNRIPNIVILLADDLGWADVGYRNGPIETPHIDILAEEGIRLERFYSAPICSPTRAALMTGRDPLALGIGYDQIHPWYNGGLAPDATTIALTLQEAGYQTGMVGKWHLGHSQPHQLPNARGFQYFHGHLQTNTDYYTHEREGGHDLQQNGQPVNRDGEYLTHIQAREAVRFLENRIPEKPFFLYVAFTAPHSPMQAPPETVSRYAHLDQKNHRRTYAAMVHEMDLAVGAILETMEKQGIAQDTLVLFFSDNGGSNIFGGVNEPLRGQKGQTFEGGIRVPAVLRWSGHLAAGAQYDGIVSAMDVFPTLISAAGLHLPTGLELDGIDIWPTLAEGHEAPTRGPVFFASEIPVPGVIHLAVIDGPWKLVQIVREGQTQTRLRSLLFNLDEDPLEKDDLSLAHPQKVERLAQEIRAWRSRHPMAGLRGTLVPHPGWVAPHDWATAVTPGHLLQPRWKNELPFSEALIDATAERGVLVDEATRRELLELQKASHSGWAPDPD